MKSVYYGKSAQDLSLGKHRIGFEMEGGVGEGRGGVGWAGRFIKILTFWFLSTKHTKTYKQQYGVCEVDFPDIQGAKRGISVLFFKPGGENTVYRLCCFSFCFLFKGERHLFLWQRQYSMD